MRATSTQMDAAVLLCEPDVKRAYAECNGGDTDSFELVKSKAGAEAGGDVQEECVPACDGEKYCVAGCKTKATREMEALGVRSPSQALYMFIL